jgi:hypothetical protein
VGFSRPFRRCNLARWGLLAGLGAVVAASAVRGDDDDAAALDAKRHSVVALIRKNDYSAAAPLALDIIGSDPSQYEDHLNLAHIYDKTGKPELALVEYQTVRDLIPSVPQNSDERSAQAEAIRRIGRLDPTAEKVEKDLEELDTKLELLQRGCRESNDQAGYDRLTAMRDEIKAMMPGRIHAVVDLSAKADWKLSGISVVAGRKYVVVADGSWQSTPGTPTDADGMQGNMQDNFQQGQLLGKIGDAAPIGLGKHMTFVANATGLLKLTINDDAKDDNVGSLHIYIGLAPPSSDSN